MLINKLIGLLIICAFSFTFSDVNAQTGTDSNSRVWGYIFGDFFWKAEGDTARWGQGEYMDTEKGMMGGSLRRLYLGYDHKLSDRFTTRVLLEANPGTLMNNGAYGAIIKLGYLQWNAPDFLFHNQQFSVGLIPTPIFSFPERSWGYRSVEKEALDSRGIGRSVDQGLSYSATFDSDANYGFTLLVANGSGTRPAADRYFEYTGSMYFRLFERRLTFETMGNYKYQGDGRHSSIYRGFLGYELNRLRFGFEAAKIRNNVLTQNGFVNVNPFLYSVFYAFKLDVFKEEFEFFVRYDKFNPDSNFTNAKIYPDNLRFVYDQSLLIFGVNYSPIPTISIIPNIYINLYDDKRLENLNRKNDVVLRFTVYYRY